jgi:hypothetical protein
LPYFTTYNLKNGWNINSGPIIATNWNNKASGDAADGDDHPRRQVANALLRRHRPCDAVGIPTGQPIGELLRKRRASSRFIALGHAAADCVSFSPEAEGISGRDCGERVSTGDDWSFF